MKIKLKTVLLIENDQGNEHYQTPIDSEIVYEDKHTVRHLAGIHAEEIKKAWEEIKRFI